MKARTLGVALRATTAAAFLVGATSSLAQDLQPINLPPPQKTGGKPLMEALLARQTIRSIGAAKLTPQVLSNLLWAAYGVNREQGPRGRPGRTAPSGMNLQPIDLYVATPEGVYIYDPAPHRLAPVLAQDVRALANRSPVAGKVPVVAHPRRQRGRPFPPSEKSSPDSSGRTSISIAPRKAWPRGSIPPTGKVWPRP